ncbi:MAG: Ig-like domain-containing protein [Clostridia bacterium]|nr:Ig-like domain-containing protein [Clostridia bacterium]
MLIKRIVSVLLIFVMLSVGCLLPSNNFISFNDSQHVYAATCIHTYLYPATCGSKSGPCTKCGAYAPATGLHKYDHNCDQYCNVCNAGPRAQNHIYNAPAANCKYPSGPCTNCGARQPATGQHKYDHNCDQYCNVCNTGPRPQMHEYNAPAATCKYPSGPCTHCGARQPATEQHKYDHNCDQYCNVCNEGPRPQNHIYNAPAADCNYPSGPCTNCGARQPKLGHNILKPATCGNSSSSCTRCPHVDPPTGAHKYDHNCDQYCNVCNAGPRPQNHIYNAPAVTCSQPSGPCTYCGARQPATGQHKYDHNCDQYCNVCGTGPRPQNHIYNAPAATCSQPSGPCTNCGARIPPTGIHIYDNDKDMLCNVCGFQRGTLVNGVSLNLNTLPLAVGKSATLVATVTPADATNKEVTWSSSNTSIASVTQSGVVTKLSKGDATITVRTNDGGFTSTCKVTDLLGIEISKPSVTETNKGPVTYTVTYTNASNITLRNENITLYKPQGSANGTISVGGTGTTTRTVTVSNITGDGILGISIEEGTASNEFGSAPGAGPSTTFIVDNTPPEIEISGPSVPSTLTGPVTYTLTYKGAKEIILSNSNIASYITLNKENTATGTVSVGGTGNLTRTVTISNIKGKGKLGISIAAGTAKDSVQNMALSAGPSKTFIVGPLAKGEGSFFYMKLPKPGTDPNLSARNSFIYTNGTEEKSDVCDIEPPAGRIFAPLAANVPGPQITVNSASQTVNITVRFKWDINIGAKFAEMKQNRPAFLRDYPYFKLVSELSVPPGWKWKGYDTNLPKDYTTHSTNFNSNQADSYQIYGSSERAECEVWTSNPEKLAAGVSYFVTYTFAPKQNVPFSGINAKDILHGIKICASKGSNIFETEHGSPLDVVYYNNSSTSSYFVVNNDVVKKRMITVSCPVEVHVYDSQGRHLGPVEDGTIEEGIPGGIYTIHGETKFISLDDNDTYSIKIDGQDDGFMHVKTELVTIEGSDRVSESSSVFNNIAVSAAFEGELSALPGGDTVQMKVDADGDGIDEQIVEPKAVIGSEGQNDTVPPSTAWTATGENGSNGWFRDNVTVGFSANDNGGGAVFQTLYRIDGKEEQIYYNPFDISSEGIHSISMYSVDTQGNFESPVMREIKIDKTAPEIVISTPQEANYGDEYILSYIINENTSGIDTVSVTVNGNPAGLGDKITLPLGDTQIKVICTDLAGNTSETVKTIHTEDTLPPAVEVAFSGTKGEGNWYSSDVTVTLTAKDDGGSGLKNVTCELNGEVFTYSQSFSITQEGFHRLVVKPADNAGNEGAAEYYEIIIDKTAPEIFVIPDVEPCINQDIEVYINCTDDISLTGSVEYGWSHTKEEPAVWIQYTNGMITQSQNGKWYLFVRGVDNAGNRVVKMFGEYFIDKVMPTITVHPKSSEWGTTDISVLAEIKDADSGIVRARYMWVNALEPVNDWVEYAGGHILQKNEGIWELKILVSDNAGNTVAGNFGPYRIDRTAPDIKVDLPADCWVNSDIRIVPQISDAISDTSEIKYAWSMNEDVPESWQDYSAGEIVQEKTGIWYLHITAKDQAQNRKTALFGPYKIDKLVPAMHVDLESTHWNNFDITVTPVFEDQGGSGIAGSEYAWTQEMAESINWSSFDSREVKQSSDGIWYLSLKVLDYAGNEVIHKFGPYKVDKAAPETSVTPESVEWSNKNVIVMPTYKDQGGSQLSSMQYAWCNKDTQPSQWKDWSEGSLVQDGEGVWYLYLRAVDTAGNKTVDQYGPYKIDKTAPVLKGTPENMEWNNTNAIVTPVFTDAGGSLVGTAQYAWSNEEAVPQHWNNCSSSIVQDQDGIWYLYIRVFDNAGNETVDKLGPYKIDKTVPDISSTPESSEWDKAVTIMPSFADRGGSQLEATYFSWCKGGEEPTVWNDYTKGELFQDADGVWYLYLKATDKAGNIKISKYGPFRIDLTPPVTSALPMNADWSNIDRVVMPGFSDLNGSGIDAMQYAWSLEQGLPEQWETYSSGAVIQEREGIWYLSLRTVDKVGNETINQYGPYKIDKTAPHVTVDVKNKDWGNTDILVTPESGDEGDSRISTVQYAWTTGETTPEQWNSYNGGHISQNKDGIWFLYLIVIDHAGNETVRSFGPYRLDKTLPTTSVLPGSSDWKNTSVSAEPSYKDEGGSQLLNLEYGWSKEPNIPSQWNNYSHGSLTQEAEGIWYLYLRAKDAAGNETIDRYGPYKNDKTAPTADAISENREWFNSENGVTLLFRDEGGSEIGTTQYAWTNDPVTPEQWNNDSGVPIYQKQSGLWHLYTRVVDMAGNETIKRFGPYKVDSIAPEISVMPGSSEWSSTGVSVTPSFKDEGGSQLNSLYYAWSMEQMAPLTWDSYSTGELKQTKDGGAWYLYLKAVDTAGNETVGKYGPYKVDKTLPTVIHFFKDEYKYNSSIKLDFQSRDTLSGIKETFVKLNGKVYKNGADVVLDMPGLNKIEITAVDRAGNVLTVTKQIDVIVEAKIIMKPDTINLKSLEKSKGNITAYIEFPEKLDIREIIMDTIRINNLIEPKINAKHARKKKYIRDYDRDKKLEFKVIFEKADFEDILVEGKNTITITGQTANYRFIGTVVIEAKKPGKGR